MQVEGLFQAMQRRTTAAAKPTKASKKLAVLDIKRATAIGVRMSKLRCACLNYFPDYQADHACMSRTISPTGMPAQA